MKTRPQRILRASARVAILLALATTTTAQTALHKSGSDPNLRRHWDASFDIRLPKGVSSDDLGERCWTESALNSYVTEGRFWIEEIYGLPYGYAGDYCLREQLTKINAALNASYASLLQSLGDAQRKKLVAAERAWIVRRNNECNVKDGVSYVMLGSVVCLMNMTSDRLKWIKHHR